jgi:hypothetical protein
MAYELKGQGSIPGRGKSLFFVQSVQTGYGAHPAIFLVGTGGSFLWGKAAIHLHLMARSRMVELYLHYPTRLRVVVLN